MAAAAGDGTTVATDVAEQLVREGLPFRRAHEQVASQVAAGERFDRPTATEAAEARLSRTALADQIARCRAEVGA
jgi:argininosuccinate lyase